MEDEQAKKPADHEWENRRLCSDGNCIGVIGPDGCCKECGLPSDGAQEQGFAEADGPDDGYQDGSGGAPHPDRTDSENTDAWVPSGDEWENRRLCSDGNCIGVIGPDGRCKACGMPYNGEPNLR